VVAVTVVVMDGFAVTSFVELPGGFVLLDRFLLDGLADAGFGAMASKDKLERCKLEKWQNTKNNQQMNPNFIL